MCRICILATIAIAAAAAAFADLTLHPIYKTYRARYAYSPATGTFGRVAHSELDVLRRGEIFDSSVNSGYFNSVDDMTILDWADLPTLSETFGEFEFDYYLDGSQPIDYAVNFYSDDNGFNDYHRDPIDPAHPAGLVLTGLPGSPDPNGPCCAGWVITVDMTGSGFNTTIAGPDKDGIAGADFSYTYHATHLGNATALGPSISTPGELYPPDPDPETGVENVFDYFAPDIDPDDPNGNFIGSFWSSSGPPWPFFQFYLVLSHAQPRCPSGLPTDCNTDIVGDAPADPPNCQIDLTDLSVLLSNFGQSGQSFSDGDVYPAVLGATPDGEVDLDDLSLMLVDFGNNCQ